MVYCPLTTLLSVTPAAEVELQCIQECVTRAASNRYIKMGHDTNIATNTHWFGWVRSVDRTADPFSILLCTQAIPQN